MGGATSGGSELVAHWLRPAGWREERHFPLVNSSGHFAEQWKHDMYIEVEIPEGITLDHAHHQVGLCTGLHLKD